MRQHPKLESPLESQPLHPVLSSALASLDIQLEEELARYRRMRAMPDRLSRPGGRHLPHRSLDLISVSAIGGRTHPTETGNQIGTPAHDPACNPAHEIAPASGNGAQTSIHSTHGTVTAAGTESSAIAEPPVEYAGDHSALAITPPPSPGAPSTDTEPTSTLSQEQIEAIVKPLNPEGLDDYLESSEELLRSLAEEEAAVQVERGFVQSLLTPLGMGSMLLLLLSSAMFGYLVMNPSSLGQLFAPRHVAQEGIPDDQANSTQAIRPQPNLADKEFKDLNLDTLGTLRADSTSSKRSHLSTSPTSPSPAVPGNPVMTAPSPSPVANRSAANSTASTAPPSLSGSYSGARSAPPVLQPEPAPVVPSQPVPRVRTYDPPQPARRYSPPSYSAPTKPTTPPPPAASSPNPPAVKSPSPAAAVSPETRTNGSGSYDYKVVIPYDSDRTLETVKEAVPDAYLRNFPDGARIQTGAYSSETDAQRQVQELRSRGIAAEVYKP